MGCRGKAVPEGAAFPLLREVNMKEKAIVAEGLAAYAIERRFGFERHRPGPYGSALSSERWTT